MIKLKKMKLWFIYLGIFATGLMSFVVMIQAAPSPETLILGEWKELKWEYEKVNKIEDTLNYKDISEEVKNKIGQHLIIHQAENWRFLPNKRIVLIGENSIKHASWRIRGRGHILQLKYDDNNSIENYNITELSEEHMVLNFDSNIQAKGIAKLTFEKK